MASSDDDDDVAYDGDALSTNENVIKCGMTTMEKVVRLRNKGLTFKVLYLQKNIFTYIDFYLIY